MKEKVDKLDISLKSANGKSVSLKSLSPEALESFLAVVSSLKSIVSSCIDDSIINFSIIEGSARCLAVAPESEMKIVYKSIDSAINGNSYDKELTSNLRVIQEQLKDDSYKYVFNYKTSGNKRKENLNLRLVEASRISVKRRSRQEYHYKLLARAGYLNEIGGNTPNYHFDYGRGEKSLTIKCSQKEAIYIKKYLYNTVTTLMVCKESYRVDKRNEYTHQAVLNVDEARVFKKFLREYNEIDNLIDKLSLTHDLIEDCFTKNFEFGLNILKYALIGFNNENFHLSELKTLLVLSTPFKNNLEISEERIAILKTYEKKKN